MIDPAGIPVIDGNMDALAGHATAISDTGRAFADTGARIHNTWQGLYPHYIAPESGQLLSATGIIATTTASVGEDLGTAGTALTTYADEVRAIQAALVALKSQAEGLAAERTAAGEDWASDSGLVERDTALIDAVNAQVAAFADAERRCANALRVLYGAPLLSVDNGDGVLDPATEHGFTAEQLDAAARNGGTPWGATSEVDHAWPIDVLHNVGSFFGGLYQSGEGAVVGIGTLLGFSGGENAGAAWGALGTLATGALVYGLVGIEEAERLDHNGSIPWLAPGAMGQSLEDAGKAFIAYDQWDDDPARAAGATLGNVILTVVGPKAVGSATRGAGAALGRIPGPVAARTSQALVGAGTTIGRTPTLADISRYARNTFPGFRSPSIEAPTLNAIPDAPARPQGGSGSTVAGAVDSLSTREMDNPRGSADRPTEPEPAIVGAPTAAADAEIPAASRGHEHSPAPVEGGTDSSHPSADSIPENADRSAIPPRDQDNAFEGSRPTAQHLTPDENPPTDRGPADEPHTRLSRQDDDFYSEVNSRRGVPKSYLNDSGDLVPANPDGITTVVEHVVGRPAEIKGNSPYTSFSGPEADPKRFGDNIIYLDVEALRNDIARGRVVDVEAISPQQVQSLIQESADSIAGRRVDLDNVPDTLGPAEWARSLGLGNEQTSLLAQRLRDMRNTRRDVEWLIKGVIPSRYLDGPYPQ